MAQASLWSQSQIHPTLWKHDFYIHQGQSFFPGQYVQVSLLKNEARVGIFSIASHPNALPFVSFYTREALRYPLSESFVFSPPAGSLIFQGPAEYALIASGTGITPFLSLIQDFSLRRYQQWKCFWIIGRQEDLRILEILDAEVRKNIEPFFYDGSDDTVLFEHLAQCLEHYAASRVYLAGSYAFVDKIGTYLLKTAQADLSCLFSDMKKFQKVEKTPSFFHKKQDSIE